jgi:urease accessory protein
MSPEPVGALLTLLQLGDGLFPAGGFAHSLGLETYAQAGIVTDRQGLEAFVRAHLEGSAGPADAVAVAAAVRAAQTDDLAGCLDLDARIDAMRIVPEWSAASRQMGRQTLRVAIAWGGLGGPPVAGPPMSKSDHLLTAFDQRVEASETPGHYPVVFGAVAGRAGVDVEAAATAYLYATAALLVNAALRLLSIGQLDGQRVLAALRPSIARLAAVAGTTSPDDMWSFTPGLELAGLRHAELEMRLFRS